MMKENGGLIRTNIIIPKLLMKDAMQPYSHYSPDVVGRTRWTVMGPEPLGPGTQSAVQLSSSVPSRKGSIQDVLMMF